MGRFVQKGDILVAAETWPLLQKAGLIDFAAFMNYAGGNRVVHKRGRSVYRFEIGDRAFYLKRNRVHRVELFKKISRFRIPPRSARQEWENILAVENAGIPTVTPVAFGERAPLGIETASFTLTEEIYGAQPLDEYMERALKRPLSREAWHKKRRLTLKIANLSRHFHGQGMNHQDFYLNHFFVDARERFYLLDLQRVQRRPRIPHRYRVKDLAQLAYSTLRFSSLTRTDKMRFFLTYLEKDHLTEQDRRFVFQILAKKERIARHDKKLYKRRRARGELV